MSAGITRFLANPQAFVLLELGDQGATASLTFAWQRTFGSEPDFETGDAVAGIHFPLDTADDAEVRGMCISRAAKGDGVGAVTRLIVARYGLDRVEIMSRPPIGIGSVVGEAGSAGGWSWVHDLARENYNADAVEIWPREPSRPIRDRVVIEHADEPGHFVHRARRSPRVDWCLPATTLEEALTFASPESAAAWVDRYGSTEKSPLVLRFRSAALALQDQVNAHRNAQVVEDTFRERESAG